MSALLFDDVPLAEAARSEHDGFTAALRDAGVSVPPRQRAARRKPYSARSGGGGARGGRR
ncbi:arginine deiminase family protein [Brevibacterium sp. p3-SID960]|uniref:arginine deiminase family protein n=1 Tax=Brevibacterium sp. p3-SID960 TaxID=2916063 RepID=UPI0037C079D3